MELDRGSTAFGIITTPFFLWVAGGLHGDDNRHEQTGSETCVVSARGGRTREGRWGGGDTKTMGRAGDDAVLCLSAERMWGRRGGGGSPAAADDAALGPAGTPGVNRPRSASDTPTASGRRVRGCPPRHRPRGSQCSAFTVRDSAQSVAAAAAAWCCGVGQTWRWGKSRRAVLCRCARWCGRGGGCPIRMPAHEQARAHGVQVVISEAVMNSHLWDPLESPGMHLSVGDRQRDRAAPTAGTGARKGGAPRGGTSGPGWAVSGSAAWQHQAQRCETTGQE